MEASDMFFRNKRFDCLYESFTQSPPLTLLFSRWSSPLRAQVMYVFQTLWLANTVELLSPLAMPDSAHHVNIYSHVGELWSVLLVGLRQGNGM